MLLLPVLILFRWGAAIIGLIDGVVLVYDVELFDKVIQIIGVVTISVWIVGTDIILFWAIDKTVVLRVSQCVEEEGLDIYEHGETAHFK